MNLIGIISSDQKINNNIESLINKEFHKSFQLLIPSGTEAISGLLNFDMPEIVIMNLMDPLIDLQMLKDQIKKDSWLHNFGIIGLYDKNIKKEEEIMKEWKDLNLLSLLDYSRINNLLGSYLKIIIENRQIIFQNDMMGKLVDRLTGSFEIKNSDILLVPLYSGLAATALLKRGKISVENKISLQLSLSELILNGIEHGNCKINFNEKTEYLEKGLGIHDLILEKNKDPEIASKRVVLEWNIEEASSRFSIKDEGDGFDVLGLKKQLKNNPQEALHGRGIMMARLLSNKILYNKKGNKVSLIILHPDNLQKSVPEGFLKEEIITVKKGEVVFKEGEISNFIYYITSGKYRVFNNETAVGTITPADVFMGEMSFLLNNSRSATVKAATEGKLIKISRKSFINVLRQYPQYGIFLSKLIATKLVRANQRNVLFAKQSL